MQRLSKILAERGISSRRGAEKIIEEKRVRVNGVLIKKPLFFVDEENDRITVDDNPIPSKEKKMYLLLNKPKGYLCTNELINKKRVIDLFRELPYRLFTVGRLDKETSGLLIVTNDGIFANKIMHPSSNIEKEYLAKVANEISHEDLIKISEGTYVEGSFVKPAFVKKVRRGTLKVIVKEGKKHEVRLLIQNTGLKILELKRIRIGPLLLGKMKEGTYRPLKQQEIDQFLKR